MDELGIQTDEELARLAELPVKTVWRSRNGKSVPRPNTARHLAAALQMDVQELQPPRSIEEDADVHERLAAIEKNLARIADVLLDESESHLLEGQESDEARAVERAESNGQESERIPGEGRSAQADG